MSEQPSAPAAARRTPSVRGNAFWTAAQQAVTLGAGFTTSVLVARTLSQADFGRFSFAVSLATVAVAISSGGLNGLAIKAIVDGRAEGRDALGTLSVIREVLAVISYVVMLGVAHLIGGVSDATTSAVALLIVFPRALDTIDFWYQATQQTRRAATPRIAVAVVALVARVVLALVHPDLLLFLALTVVEACVGAAVTGRRLARERDRTEPVTYDRALAASLLGGSWILLLSSVAATLNSRGDVLILQAMTGPVEVGQYAAAVRISEILFFIPTAVMTAAFPGLLALRRAHGAASAQYRDALQKYYDAAFWIGVAVAVVLAAVGPLAIRLLFGPGFAESGTVLRIQLAALPFVFMAAVYSKWIIAEGHLVASLVRHVAGAAVNIAANLALIPVLGIVGAAIATVVSYVLASYVTCFFGRSMRPAGAQMTRAFVAPVRWLRRG